METMLNSRNLDAIRAGCQPGQTKDTLSLGWERYTVGMSSKKKEEKKKSASGSTLAKRNLAEQYFSFAEGLCMPIEMVTSVEEGQSERIQCSFMAALLSQGKGLQREPLQPAGWLMNGVTIVEEIKKLTSAPSSPITGPV